jgi:hypothetical protein
MNDEKILLDSAYIKLRNGEPMSLMDLRRIIDLIDAAPFYVQQATEAEVAGVQSDFIGRLQRKFMQGNKQT